MLSMWVVPRARQKAVLVRVEKLDVDSLRREQRLTAGVHRHRPVMNLYGVDSDPYPRVRRAQARHSVTSTSVD